MRRVAVVPGRVYGRSAFQGSSWETSTSAGPSKMAGERIARNTRLPEPGVVGAMDHIDRDVRQVAGTEQAFLAIDPLLGLAFDDIDDFLQRGVPMELVGLAVGHGDPHEQEFLGLGQARSTEPFMRAPGELLDLDVIGLDESEHGL